MGKTGNPLPAIPARVPVRKTLLNMPSLLDGDAHCIPRLKGNVTTYAGNRITPNNAIGDRDLLTLKVFRNIPIVTAAEAVILATK